MSKLDHAASLISSDAAAKQKATLQQRTTNRKSINSGYNVLFLRRKVASTEAPGPLRWSANSPCGCANNFNHRRQLFITASADRAPRGGGSAANHCGASRGYEPHL